MDNFEKAFYNTDFSKHTDLKARLADKLFGSKKSSKVVSFTRIADEDAAFVNAAQGIYTENNDLLKKDH